IHTGGDSIAGAGINFGGMLEGVMYNSGVNPHGLAYNGQRVLGIYFADVPRATASSSNDDAMAWTAEGLRRPAPNVGGTLQLTDGTVYGGLDFAYTKAVTLPSRSNPAYWVNMYTFDTQFFNDSCYNYSGGHLNLDGVW